MKLILILTFLFITQLDSQGYGAHSKEIFSKNKFLKDTKFNSTAKLKANEYTLNINNTVKKFSTKKYEELELSQDCFKTKKINCEAYLKSIKKIDTKPEDHMKSPYHNNFGAIHCSLIGGVGLIAKTSKGNETDFCKFSDGSMVDSWSAYYKTNPQKK